MPAMKQKIDAASADQLVTNPNGLVPIAPNFSEAGYGVIAGEVIGVSPKVAFAMVKNGSAAYVADWNLPDPVPKSAKA